MAHRLLYHSTLGLIVIKREIENPVPASLDYRLVHRSLTLAISAYLLSHARSLSNYLYVSRRGRNIERAPSVW